LVWDSCYTPPLPLLVCHTPPSQPCYTGTTTHFVPHAHLIPLYATALHSPLHPTHTHTLHMPTHAVPACTPVLIHSSSPPLCPVSNGTTFIWAGMGEMGLWAGGTVVVVMLTPRHHPTHLHWVSCHPATACPPATPRHAFPTTFPYRFTRDQTCIQDGPCSSVPVVHSASSGQPPTVVHLGNVGACGFGC